MIHFEVEIYTRPRHNKLYVYKKNLILYSMSTWQWGNQNFQSYSLCTKKNKISLTVDI